MTKEELQKWLKNLKSDIGNSQHHELWHYEQAIDIVIEALSDKDINVPNNDCISRQDAIDALAKQMPRSYTPDGSHPADEAIFMAQEIYADCIETIEILPSAQHEIVRCKDCAKREYCRTSNTWAVAKRRYEGIRNTTVVTWNDAIVTIKSAPTIEPEPHWIPVTERLPEDLAEVIVTWINTDPEPYYDFVKDKPATAAAVCYKGDWYWYSSVTADVLAEYGRMESEKFDDAVKVIAWMPLPEPYKEET